MRDEPVVNRPPDGQAKKSCASKRRGKSCKDAMADVSPDRLQLTKENTGTGQPMDAQVLTPSGLVRLGDVAKGTCVIGRDGKAHPVTAVCDRGDLPVVRVTFSDGTSTECSEGHLWLTQNAAETGRRPPVPTVKSLAKIRDQIDSGKRSIGSHKIPILEPVVFDGREELPLHGYVLGALLGDGCLTAQGVPFCNPETDILENLERWLPSDDLLVHGSDGINHRITPRVQRSPEHDQESHP